MPPSVLCADQEGRCGCAKAWVMLGAGFRAGACYCVGAISERCGSDPASGSQWGLGKHHREGGPEPGTVLSDGNGDAG